MDNEICFEFFNSWFILLNVKIIEKYYDIIMIGILFFIYKIFFVNFMCGSFWLVLGFYLRCKLFGNFNELI